MYEYLERFWPVVPENLQSCVVGEGRYQQHRNYHTPLVASSVGSRHVGHAVKKSSARMENPAVRHSFTKARQFIL
jgi:hypothetical protein